MYRRLGITWNMQEDSVRTRMGVGDDVKEMESGDGVQVYN
jgi:hypothetical protein